MSPRCRYCGQFVKIKDCTVTWDYTWNPDIEYFHDACHRGFLDNLKCFDVENKMRQELISKLGQQLLDSNKRDGCHENL